MIKCNNHKKALQSGTDLAMDGKQYGVGDYSVFFIVHIDETMVE